MLDHVQSPVLAQVAAVVAEVLSKHGVTERVAADDDLAQLGMTSIDMVELMLGVEAEFDIGIPSADITLGNFRSIASVTAMVSRLIAKS